MKKILFLDHAEVVGGAQLVLVNYLKYLSKEKYFKIVASSGSSDFLTEKFNTFADKHYKIPFGKLKISSPLAILRFVKSVIATIKIVREEKVDIICTNTERAMYVGTLASIITKKKLYWFVRDYLYNLTLFKLLSKYTEKIFFVSKDIRDFYSSPKNSLVIYVSSDMFERVKKVTDEQRCNFREKYNLNGKFVVGFIGRLAKWKGVEVLANAMRKIQKDDVVCLIVGERQEKEKLEFVNSPNILYLGFSQNIEVVFSILSVFVHPAIEKEPFATSIVEAMMAKVPVIATNLGGTSEIVVDGVTGIVIKPNSQSYVASAILRVYDMRKEIENMVEKAYNLVLKNNRVEYEIEKIEKVFDE